MSQINVNTIKDKSGFGAPNFPAGLTVTGVITATTLNQNATGDLDGLRNARFTGVTTSTGGFNGPLTGNVTGDATGLSGTPNITVGSVTGTTGSFTGNVSVGGTLTYDDVTNIDSVGLITARNGVHVTAGVSTFATSIDGASYEGNFVLDSYLFG